VGQCFLGDLPFQYFGAVSWQWKDIQPVKKQTASVTNGFL